MTPVATMDSRIFSPKSLRSCVSIATRVRTSPPSVLQHIVDRATERIEMEAAEALKALLDNVRAAEALEAVEAMKVTRPTKAAKPIKIKRAQDKPRRSPRIKAALRNSRRKAAQGIRRSARIKTARSSSVKLPT
jgi:hypothetical protein